MEPLPLPINLWGVLGLLLTVLNAVAQDDGPTAVGRARNDSVCCVVSNHSGKLTPAWKVERY